MPLRQIIADRTIPPVTHFLHTDHIRFNGLYERNVHCGARFYRKTAPAFITNQKIGTHNADLAILRWFHIF